MKKLNYLLLGAAGLLMFSCANEDLQAPGSGEGFQITVNLPGDLGTRAGEDMRLNYAVYNDANELVENNFITFSGNSTTLNLKLASGKEYTMAFFAQNVATYNETTDEAVYVFDAADKTVSVNYENMNDGTANNSGVYDCFYGSKTGITPDGNSIAVTLYRPLAQINWGTNDLDAETVKNIFGEGDNLSMYATLNTMAYSQFNILTGELLGDKAPITLGSYIAPTSLSYPVGSEYQYVAMQYVLAGPSSQIYDLNLNVSNTQTPSTGETTDVVVSSAPLQANFRTNIYGSLFTDDLSIQITLGDWDGPDYESLTPISDGLYFDENTKTYTITNGKGLQEYAQIANNATPQEGGALSQYTVLLGNDIDMTDYNATYTPFDNQGATFDGQNYTISNLKLTSTGKESIGFMTSARGTVKNLNFKDVTISGEYKVGVLAGDGLCAEIDNVNVDGAVLISSPMLKSGTTYDEGNNVGGIVGYLSAEPNASITNCTVNNLNATAYRKVGGIVGYVGQPDAVITGNKVTNSEIYANQFILNGSYDFSDNGGSPYGVLAGEIVGGYSTGATVSNNTPDNVSVNTIQFEAGGNYTINSLFGLQTLLMDQNKNVLRNKTISIKAEGNVIDLRNKTIEPIQGWTTVGDWQVNINGNGVTIKNFTVTSTKTGSSAGHFGLFNAIGAKINDLNIDGMTLNPDANITNAGLVGFFGGTMTNVNVTNSNIGNKNTNAGMLVANCGGGGTFINCTIDYCEIACRNVIFSSKVGGMVGYSSEGGNVTFSDCVVKNTKVTNSAALGGSTGIYLGSITGGGKVSYSNCTVENSTVNGKAATPPTNTN